MSISDFWTSIPTRTLATLALSLLFGSTGCGDSGPTYIINVQDAGSAGQANAGGSGGSSTNQGGDAGEASGSGGSGEAGGSSGGAGGSGEAGGSSGGAGGSGEAGGSSGAGGVGTGGAGAAGSGAGGVSTGGAGAAGSGGSPAGAIGAPCADNSECDSGACVPDKNEAGPTGWTDGYCISPCSTHDDCLPVGVCVDFGDNVAACLANCANSPCRAGYVCEPSGEFAFCVPDCNYPSVGCVPGAVCRADGLCEIDEEATCQLNLGVWCSADLECVLPPLVCDGSADCSDGSDEEGCPPECTPGQSECVDSTLRRVCEADGMWSEVECVSSACVGGQCVGVCSPGTVTCAGVAATSCTLQGQWVTQDCDFGCIADPVQAYDWFHADPGCAPHLNACSRQCAAPLYTGCNCCIAPQGQEWVCEDSAEPFQSPGYPRPCALDTDCGTLGYCATQEANPVCRRPTPPCSPTQYTCPDGECIPASWECDGFGDCALDEDEVDCETAPPTWTCSASFYDALDGCDCDCGAWDPDCDVAGQFIYNCAGTQVCVQPGICE